MKLPRILDLCQSEHRRRNVANGVYAVAEYVSQPLVLLLSAPFLLKHMGTAQFGVWVLATSAVNAGNSISTGFGDAAVRYVAMYRGQGDDLGTGRVVRAIILINFVLSGLLAIGLWFLSPYAANHIAHIDQGMRSASQQSFRIGGLLLIPRSIESVFSSTLRAWEQYGPPVGISICSRVATVLASIALTASRLGVVEIMLATLSISVCAAVAQGWAVRRRNRGIVLLPSLDFEMLKLIGNFGCFSWLQALSAVIFGQADRLLVGIFLGAPAVSIYALCDQAAQSVHGVVAAGLNFLFPHLSARIEAESLSEFAETLWIALKWNTVLALLLSAPLILFSRSILTAWIGHSFAAQAWPVLSLLSVGSAMLAMNVTAYYGLLAAGRIRLVMVANLVAGAAMGLTIILLMPHFGIAGASLGWLIPGPVTCLLYIPLFRIFRSRSASGAGPSVAGVWENCR